MPNLHKNTSHWNRLDEVVTVSTRITTYKWVQNIDRLYPKLSSPLSSYLELGVS